MQIGTHGGFLSHMAAVVDFCPIWQLWSIFVPYGSCGRFLSHMAAVVDFVLWLIFVLFGK